MRRSFSGWLAAGVFTLLAAAPLKPAAAEWSRGHILVKENLSFAAEYQATTGGVFVRTANRGAILTAENLESIVSQDYYARVRGGSALGAAAETVYTLGSGEKYRWSSGNEAWSQMDWIHAGIKLGLLLTTGALYVRAQDSSTKIGRSILYVNDEAARARFRTDRNNFNLAAGLTAAFFLYSAARAYFVFDTDESGRPLNIPDRAELSADEYLLRQGSQVFPNSAAPEPSVQIACLVLSF